MENVVLKNQPCYDKDGNFLGWFSRSVAVVTFIFRQYGNELQVLLEKRGKGCPDNVGRWCSVCGYLEFNDTLEDTAVKETLQETGIEIEKEQLVFYGLSSSPDDNKQNVSVHYLYFDDKIIDFDMSKAVGGEENEVEELTWVTIGKLCMNVDGNISLDFDYSKLGEYDICFNHGTLIRKYSWEYFLMHKKTSL